MEKFQIIHKAENGISPIDLMCIYGTISIPETPGIIWLDRNLGAIIRPNKVDDKRFMAAGLYFQFGRKQGYFYDQSRLLDTPWDDLIAVEGSWPEDQNPCIELGPGWRLPTKDELVAAAGAWGTWFGAWKSPLKFHAAGWLYTHGKLKNRGLNGIYWSSDSPIPERGFKLDFNPGASRIFASSKAYGYTIRPVKDI